MSLQFVSTTCVDSRIEGLLVRKNTLSKHIRQHRERRNRPISMRSEIVVSMLYVVPKYTHLELFVVKQITLELNYHIAQLLQRHWRREPKNSLRQKKQNQ